ncbi:MAG: transposase family protein [PVC group bacterium]|nr:transposase family protein [PVC group bacterium]
MLGDSGYQGIKDIHFNSRSPPPPSKKEKKLTKRQKLYNHLLSNKHIVVENIIRRYKIFRITKETYRGKYINHGKIWNFIAGLVNLRYGESVI